MNPNTNTTTPNTLTVRQLIAELQKLVALDRAAADMRVFFELTETRAAPISTETDWSVGETFTIPLPLDIPARVNSGPDLYVKL